MHNIYIENTECSKFACKILKNNTNRPIDCMTDIRNISPIRFVSSNLQRATLRKFHLDWWSERLVDTRTYGRGKFGSSFDPDSGYMYRVGDVSKGASQACGQSQYSLCTNIIASVILFHLSSWIKLRFILLIRIKLCTILRSLGVLTHFFWNRTNGI